ncbi:unnamed protein product [Lampetra planeri]
MPRRSECLCRASSPASPLPSSRAAALRGRQQLQRQQRQQQRKDARSLHGSHSPAAPSRAPIAQRRRRKAAAAARDARVLRARVLERESVGERLLERESVACESGREREKGERGVEEKKVERVRELSSRSLCVISALSLGARALRTSSSALTKLPLRAEEPSSEEPRARGGEIKRETPGRTRVTRGDGKERKRREKAAGAVVSRSPAPGVTHPVPNWDFGERPCPALWWTRASCRAALGLRERASEEEEGWWRGTEEPCPP